MADVETKDITKEGTEVKAEYEIVKSKAAPKHLGIPEAVFVVRGVCTLEVEQNKKKGGGYCSCLGFSSAGGRRQVHAGSGELLSRSRTEAVRRAV